MLILKSLANSTPIQELFTAVSFICAALTGCHPSAHDSALSDSDEASISLLSTIPSFCHPFLNVIMNVCLSASSHPE